MRKRLIKVGFWGSSDSGPGLLGRAVKFLIDAIEPLPDPRTLIDLDWAEAERETVARYLDAGKRVEQYMGYSLCRLCSDDVVNGSADLSDGVYLWPEGFAHYVRMHRVKPPKDFVRHVLAPKRS